MRSSPLKRLGIAILTKLYHKTTLTPSVLLSKRTSYANGNPRGTNGPDGVSCFAIIPTPIADEKTDLFVIGTKRGSVILAKFNNDLTSTSLLPRLEVLDSLTIGKYPVYSLVCTKGRTKSTALVYAGCGDRYVSIVQVMVDGVSQSHLHSAFEPSLGPHTGWVKAVIEPWDENRLYSIGCNRIEGWETQHWSKVGTLAIGSSTKGACTLSSDLLCLVKANKMILVAGGVDGRLHLFREGRSMPEPISNVSAHEGRINALWVEPITGLLFSASHDGTIACWSFEGDGIIAHVATVHIRSARALSCASWYEDSKLFVATGTNDGHVEIYVAAVRWGQPEITLDFAMQSRLSVTDEPGPVNAILLVRPESKAFLLIGHSKGLHIHQLKQG